MTKKFINVCVLLGLVGFGPAFAAKMPVDNVPMDEADFSAILESFGLEGVTQEQLEPALNELSSDFEFETIAGHASLVIEKAAQISRTAKQLSKSNEVERDRTQLLRLKQLMIQLAVVAREMDATLSFKEEPRGFRKAQTDAAMAEIAGSQERAEATALGMGTLAQVKEAMMAMPGQMMGRAREFVEEFPERAQEAKDWAWEKRGKIAKVGVGLGITASVIGTGYAYYGTGRRISWKSVKKAEKDLDKAVKTLEDSDADKKDVDNAYDVVRSIEEYAKEGKTGYVELYDTKEGLIVKADDARRAISRESEEEEEEEGEEE